MILPVDQNARASPRQRYLPLDRLCTTLASVLRTSIHLKNLQKTEWRRCGRSRSDAQVSDGTTKTLREKLRTRGTVQKLSQSLKYSPSVKKYSKRAYLRSSLESLIYLCTFSLLTVTHLNTCLASSCTRVTIWSVLCLSVTSYSSGCSTKLLMQGVTRCIAALERDLFCVASTGVTMHTFPVASPAAIMICFTCFTVHVLTNCSLASTSG